ncbi:MAG: undecaprenyl-diphosphatase [Methanobacterium sp.]|nr:undecaprenyl-diphosphatase [Methanobacterium sp.]
MIEQLNFALFHLINQYAGMSPAFDTLIVVLAKYMPLLVVVGMIVLWIFKDRKARDILLYGFYAAIIGLLINYLIGFVYYHPRPFVIPTGTLLFSYPADSSFPSDHSTIIFSMAIMLMYFKETRVAGLIFLVMGIIGGTARVFSGVHFPLDIAGSLLVSVISVFIILQLRNQLNPINNFIMTIYGKIPGRGG